MMKFIQKIIYIGMIIFLIICFAGCQKSEETDSDNENNQTEDQDEEDAEEKFPNNEYSFDVSSEIYQEDFNTLEYPQLIDSNIPSVDDINESIYSHILQAVQDETININPEYITSLSTVYGIEQYNNVLLSIAYVGTTYVEEFDLVSSFFTGNSILLDTGDRVYLSDLFYIDQNFVDIVQFGMYSPYSEDLDLEASGVNIFEMLADNYTDDELMGMFDDYYSDFMMTDYGLFLSIPVPTEFGDHLDLAINYEWLESNMKDDYIVWETYMPIAGSEGSTDDIAIEEPAADESIDWKVLLYKDVFDWNRASEEEKNKIANAIQSLWLNDGITGEAVDMEITELVQEISERMGDQANVFEEACNVFDIDPVQWFDLLNE